MHILSETPRDPVAARRGTGIQAGARSLKSRACQQADREPLLGHRMGMTTVVAVSPVVDKLALSQMVFSLLRQDPILQPNHQDVRGAEGKGHGVEPRLRLEVEPKTARAGIQRASCTHGDVPPHGNHRGWLLRRLPEAHRRESLPVRGYDHPAASRTGGVPGLLVYLGEQGWKRWLRRGQRSPARA